MREQVKTILEAMMQGWVKKGNEKSETDLEQEDFMDFAGGDEGVARFMELASYWSNDLLVLAGESFDLCIEQVDGLQKVVPTPPRPEPHDQHYWSPGDWTWHDNDHHWSPGKWMKINEDLSQKDYPA